MIDLDDVDTDSVDPAVALGECRRLSAHCGGAIVPDRDRPWCIHQPGCAVRQQNGMSQIKIFTPMVIVASVDASHTRLLCIRLAGNRQPCLVRPVLRHTTVDRVVRVGMSGRVVRPHPLRVDSPPALGDPLSAIAGSLRSSVASISVGLASLLGSTIRLADWSGGPIDGRR